MSDTNDLPKIAPPNLQNYPKRLSLPLPPISKAMELSRAMISSSKSVLFVISRADFIHEDEWLVAMNKPQGIYCEAVLESVRKALSHSEIEPEVHLAKRLDRDTSGVMVVTKSHKVAAKLVKAFTARKVSKTYLASCSGMGRNHRQVGPREVRIWAWRVYAASDIGRSLPGGEVLVAEEISVSMGREGEKEEENVVVMVRARPRSGSTHQIRLHCQYLGISNRGDVKYSKVINCTPRHCRSYTPSP